MPNHEGRFHLHSDMSKIATGSVFLPNSKWKTKIDSLCQQETSRSSQKLFDNRIRTMQFGN